MKKIPENGGFVFQNEPTGRGYLRPVEEVLDGFRSLWQGIEEVANGFAFGS